MSENKNFLEVIKEEDENGLDRGIDIRPDIEDLKREMKEQRNAMEKYTSDLREQMEILMQFVGVHFQMSKQHRELLRSVLYEVDLNPAEVLEGVSGAGGGADPEGVRAVDLDILGDNVVDDMMKVAQKFVDGKIDKDLCGKALQGALEAHEAKQRLQSRGEG